MPQADSPAAKSGTAARRRPSSRATGARVQPGGAAEGEQGVVARVDAAAHGGDAHAIGHARH